jgi:OPT family oligopeptide transporter
VIYCTHADAVNQVSLDAEPSYIDVCVPFLSLHHIRSMLTLLGFSRPTVVILLLVYPVGCLWARVMPTRTFTTFGRTWSLNTGPFTIKEHTVITLMANVTYGYAYSTDALLALQAKPLYNVNMGWGFALLFTLSSQVLGIAISGMFRRFNVWPAALIWPANFGMTSLLYALHDKSKTDPEKANGWQISRYRYFLYVCLGSFVWYWFPGVS